MNRSGNNLIPLNLRWCLSIFALSWNIAVKAMPQCCYRPTMKWISTRLRHCFGYDVIRYCVYTDGAFDLLISLLLKKGVILTDTYALHGLLRNACRGLDIKVYCLSGLIKKELFIKCARSCIQLDLCIKLITLIHDMQPIVVIGTAPTTVFRLIEITKPLFIIATVCGQINSIFVKVGLRLGRLGLGWCVLRGKIGGLGFASGMINGIAMAAKGMIR
ncbi:Precorrin-8X methylmutase [Candidatus Hodgkinia cicadicola]|uniref:Precorrin-8X methylmutase n=1 Tax=Candidatus Hodgkinia cicadicola TaxID=573658 RepID=A0ABX4MGF8_9HYPH|nr:Precorrin-8X methylmutase [Candidatus Hodgkinia cicadicola]